MTAVVLQPTGVPLTGLLELSVAEVYLIIDHDCLGEPGPEADACPKGLVGAGTEP